MKTFEQCFELFKQKLPDTEDLYFTNTNSEKYLYNNGLIFRIELFQGNNGHVIINDIFGKDDTIIWFDDLDELYTKLKNINYYAILENYLFYEFNYDTSEWIKIEESIIQQYLTSIKENLNRKNIFNLV